MDDILKLDQICQYNEIMGVETLNPLVGVVDCYELAPIRFSRKLLGFYGIFVKDTKYGELQYGRSTYDYQEGSVIFVAPGQLMGSPDDGTFHHAKGYVFMFHPDFIRGTILENCMNNYGFFSYESNEALHLSQDERKIMLDCFEKIKAELKNQNDKHSKSLIINYIKLFLDYCLRFYDRQFETRETINHDTLHRFEKELNVYFNSDLPEKKGLPSVQYFAERINLSANYFSDLIRKATSTNALKYIHLKILDIAKNKMQDKNKTITEIAYELGFSSPQHFSRMFKKNTGFSPNKYRMLN